MSMTAVELPVANVPYDHYLRVRSWVQRIAAPDDERRLTDCERTRAAALSPIWDASPHAIGRLRHLTTPFGGAAMADYQDPESQLAKAIRRDLKRLFVQVGHDLFVEEPPILGGFGCRTTAGRCNTDTVRFFSALVALQDGAVLTTCRQQNRCLVWEIGGGWGGFAYQFKTICPNVTYLITGSPESLLVSATYLLTAFPGARCAFYGESAVEALWDQWEQIDFIFAPDVALDRLRLPRLDLTIDVEALADFTPERIEQHVRHAFAARCPYFYSLHHGDWAAGDFPAVWRAIDESFWLNPVPPRVELRKADAQYSHAIGWRRLLR